MSRFEDDMRVQAFRMMWNAVGDYDPSKMTKDGQELRAELRSIVGLGPDKVIVPREPTEAMIDAAFGSVGSGSTQRDAERSQYKSAYKLMIAAAEKDRTDD